jgi:hypothetical protein
VNYADDEGYFNANPVLVKAGTNPLRTDKTKIEDQLDQLEAIGYIEIRKSGIKHYGRICNFDEHQRVSHKVNSKIKERFESLRRTAGGPPEDRRNVSALNGIEGNGIEQGTGNGKELETLASTAIAVPAARGKLVCTLPLNSGEYEVFEADVQEWQALYPAVDVRQELRSIKGWALSNPTRRKTKSGIGRFINSWISRSQNEAKPGGGNGNKNHSKTGGNLDAAAQAIRFLEQEDRNRQAADASFASEAGSCEPGDFGAVCIGSGEILPPGH